MWVQCYNGISRTNAIIEKTADADFSTYFSSPEEAQHFKDQAIGEAFGGKVIRAKRVMHGKTDTVHTTQQGVFGDLPKEFTVTRYHSLAIEKESLPTDLEITAWTDDGEIMGVRHKKFAVEGVQFHPESILSEYGHELLNNFLKTK